MPYAPTQSGAIKSSSSGSFYLIEKVIMKNKKKLCLDSTNVNNIQKTEISSNSILPLLNLQVTPKNSSPSLTGYKIVCLRCSQSPYRKGHEAKYNIIMHTATIQAVLRLL